jgi:hypothetical protein
MRPAGRNQDKEIAMNKKTIRIKTKKGKVIERSAPITDWIDNDGNRTSTAQIGKVIYRVIDRDYYGAIFCASGNYKEVNG